MLHVLKRRAALLGVAGALGIAGSALAASPALAYHYTYSNGGAAVPVGTQFAMSGGSLSFINSSGATDLVCPGWSLSGVVGSASGTTGSELNLTGGTASQCVLWGSPVYITVNASSSSLWQVIPVSGTTSPFTGKVTGINVTLRCGSPTATPVTYSGSLTSGVTETNSTSGSYITLSNAASLSRSGSGCSFLGTGNQSVTQTLTLTQVNNSPVSATNNLWLNNN